MAGAIAALSILKMFRYQTRTPDYFTSSAQVAGSGTDYYKMATQYYGYTFVGIFSLLTLTHLLAWMGTMVSLDYVITMAFNFWAFPLVHMIGGVLVMLAYDNAYTVSLDTSNLTNYSASLSLMSTIQSQATTLAMIETARYLI